MGIFWSYSPTVRTKRKGLCPLCTLTDRELDVWYRSQRHVSVGKSGLLEYHFLIHQCFFESVPLFECPVLLRIGGLQLSHLRKKIYLRRMTAVVVEFVSTNRNEN